MDWQSRRSPNPATGFPGTLYADVGGFTHAAQTGPGLAVIPNSALLEIPPDRFLDGYVTLVENAHPDRTDLGPVTLHVVRLDRQERFRGAIKTIESRNVFDEKLVLKHNADFGGNLEKVTYEWWYTPVTSGDVGTPDAPKGAANWKLVPGENENMLKLEGNPTLLLGDLQFFCRYRESGKTSSTSCRPIIPGVGRAPAIHRNCRRTARPVSPATRHGLGEAGVGPGESL